MRMAGSFPGLVLGGVLSACHWSRSLGPPAGGRECSITGLATKRSFGRRSTAAPCCSARGLHAAATSRSWAARRTASRFSTDGGPIAGRAAVGGLGFAPISSAVSTPLRAPSTDRAGWPGLCLLAGTHGRESEGGVLIDKQRSKVESRSRRTDRRPAAAPVNAALVSTGRRLLIMAHHPHPLGGDR